MDQAFKKRQLSFLVQCTLLAAILFGLHFYLLDSLFDNLILFYPLWHIYLFHFIVTIIVFTILNFIFSLGGKDIFVAFMVATFLKMGAAIVFLLPLILSDLERKQPDVFNFFIPYFIFLFLEVFGITKFLQKMS